MTLEEVVAEFEAAFPAVVDGFPSALSETGEPYTVICSGGPRPESSPVPALYASRSLAIRAWLEAVRAFAKDKTGTLYWRIRPEIDSIETKAAFPSVPFWAVYSRLLISDKSPDCVHVGKDGVQYVQGRLEDKPPTKILTFGQIDQRTARRLVGSYVWPEFDHPE